MGTLWGRRTGWTLLVVGLLLMVGAALWAPTQPELLTSGACQVAPCGTLEDPSRWRAAWLPWALGAGLALLGTALAVRPRPSPPWWVVLVGLLVAVVDAVFLGVVAVFVSWSTSVHGAATVLVAGFALPVAAVLAGLVKGRARHPDLRDSRPRRVLA